MFEEIWVLRYNIIKVRIFQERGKYFQVFFGMWWVFQYIGDIRVKFYDVIDYEVIFI